MVEDFIWARNKDMKSEEEIKKSEERNGTMKREKWGKGKQYRLKKRKRGRKQPNLT
jgi:hypothetical protein